MYTPILLLAAYLLKATVLSGVLYAYYHFVLRDKQTFGWNRFYLLAATVLSVGAPLLNIPFRIPGMGADAPTLVHLLKVIPGAGEAGMEDGAIAAGTTLQAFPWDKAALCLYGAVAAALLGLVGYHFGALSRLRRRSERLRIDDVTVIPTDAPGTPFSFFHWIFWDRALAVNSERGRAIFRHELAHVRQRHSLDKMALQVVCALLFPVFPLYLIRRELQLVHEYLADDEAVGKKDAEVYARYLVEHALRARTHSLSSAFHQHPLAKRIAMIQQSLLQQARASAWRRWLALPLFCGGFGLFAFTLQLYPPPPPVHDATRVLTVVIDAGHGGADPGAQAHGVLEKNINLAIARDVARLAPGYPVRILLSRDADTVLRMADRLGFCADHRADLCVSIHVNNDEDSPPSKSGIESYLATDRNQYFDSSVVLGSLLEQRLGMVYPAAPALRQRKSAHIAILDRNTCPAVLVECGYMSNQKDLAFVRNATNQEKIARGILESLADYARGAAATRSLPVRAH